MEATTSLPSNNNNNENSVRLQRTNQLLDQLVTRQARLQCLNKIDTHIDQALDSVRCKDKKRKYTKLTTGTCKDVDKIDLSSSDSLLTQVKELKNLLNLQTFQSLPLYYQYKLAKLLPKSDQQTLPNGWTTITSNALNNEFFNRALHSWISRLKENKLTSEFAIKRKSEQEKERLKVDPWKLKHFEPVWGDASLKSNENNELNNNKNNIIDEMYKLKIPTARRTGIKQSPVSFAPSPCSPMQFVQITPYNNPGNQNVQITTTKELSSARKVNHSSSKNYLVSNVGKIQPVHAQITNNRLANANAQKKLVSASPSKNMNLQVVKNPQASKYRINANESNLRAQGSTTTLICTCSHKAMKLCFKCSCFGHHDCFDLDGLCHNCSQSKDGQ